MISTLPGSMRIRRTFPIILAVLVIAAAVTLAVELRKIAPPEAARLLPGADGFFYLDLKTVRRVNAGHELPRVSHDPEYERFIQQTGVEFERDLDEAAFAIHYPSSWPSGGNGVAAPQIYFSEVFVGKFQSQRLTDYFRQIARSVENYRSVDIFAIPVEDRLLRVAVLSADSLAASNHKDDAVIKGIIDRSQRLASPFGGPALLRQYYKHVQLASLAWVIARVDASSPELADWSAVFARPATLVVSASALSPLHLRPEVVHIRAEAFAQSEADANAIADKVNTFLLMTRSAEIAVGTRGTDADVKALFDSLRVKQVGDDVLLTAAVPYGFLRKMFSGTPPQVAPPTPVPPSQTPAPSR